jgi:hypothetical protein
MMMPLVPPLAAVVLGQPDPARGDAIHGSDVNTISPDHLHSLFDPTFRHVASPRIRFGALKNFLAPFGQKFKPRFLIGNALRHQIIVCSTGVGGRLLDQLAKVVPCDSDLVVDVSGIGDRVGHEQSPL